MSKLTSAFSQRAVIYGILIGIPAGFLVSTGLYASYRNRQTIVRLERLRLLLTARNLANEWEDAVLEQAESCLRQITLSGSVPSSCAVAAGIYRLRGSRLVSSAEVDDISRRLVQDVGTRARLNAGQVYVLAYNTPPYAQIFYMGLAGTGGQPPVIVAISVDLEKVRAGPFGFAGRQKATGLNARLVSAESPPAGEEIVVFFGSLFPFWRISVAPPTEPLPAEVLVGAGIGLLGASGLFIAAIWLARQANDREAFLSGVTHALKLPLANIRLYAEILRGKHGTSPESLFQFDTIIYQCDSLSRRIDNVLAATQIGIAGRHYHLQLRNLVDVVRSTLEVCRGWAAHAGHELHEEFPDHEVECLIDGDAVSSAVVSLVENAVKYSHRHSAICVRVAEEREHAIIEVRDEGLGIPAGEETRIFQRFRRGSRGAEKGGFGLGLFLVRHTVVHHGGSVRVISSPGSGSKFQLIFRSCRRS